jgi:chemotaxis protein methyltransferase CheR
MADAGACPLGQADIAVLARVSGIALAAYRPEHVARSVTRVADRHGLRSQAELAGLCQRSPAALAELRRSLLVPGIGLVSDPGQLDLLRWDLLPGLLRGRPGLRVWSAGCSTGGELYRVGLLLRQYGALPGSRLLGSDLLAERIDQARHGPPGTGAVPADLRAAVRWECRDLVRDPAPAGLFDLVLCRNVAIYLAAGAQQALHAKLAAALRRGGVLLLGRAERLLRPEQLGLAEAAPHAYRKEAACGAA